MPHEQELLVAHETIVLQHPFYWYSCPPLLKQWIDLVLTYGFAFGHDGVALQGKRMITATSTGGSAETYDAEGLNHYTMREFLRPFEQTARLCRMTYLPPFVIPGTHKRPDKDIPAFADRYARLLDWLPELSVTDQLLHRETINDLIPD
ncbi:MAG: NAD(P)H-dependent oxidoreductase [Verrucomicrobiota bacterium]